MKAGLPTPTTTPPSAARRWTSGRQPWRQRARRVRGGAGRLQGTKLVLPLSLVVALVRVHQDQDQEVIYTLICKIVLTIVPQQRPAVVYFVMDRPAVALLFLMAAVVVLRIVFSLMLPEVL